MNPVQRQLVIAHLPLVKLIASGWRRRLPRWVLLDDLVGYGSLGLCRAVLSFKEGTGASLRTWCTGKIHRAIQDGLRQETFINGRTMARAIAAGRPLPAVVQATAWQLNGPCPRSSRGFDRVDALDEIEGWLRVA